jgi:hypothetical protein
MIRSGEGRRRARSLGENLKTLIFRGWYGVQIWLRMVCNQENYTKFNVVHWLAAAAYG